MSSLNTNYLRNLNSKTEATNLKLTLLQSFFLRNITFNTSLYSSNHDSNVMCTTAVNDLNISGNNLIRNFFISTTFADLLQQSDLHTLNTVNASTNASSKLYLNSNYAVNSFKS